MTSTAIILFLLVTHVLKFHRVVISLTETTSTLPTRDSVRGSSSGPHNYGPGSSSLADSREIFRKDDLRVRSINRRHAFHQYSTNGVTGYNSNTPNDYVLSEGAGIFTTQVAFGTPQSTFNLLLDTGSSTTWLKCKQRKGGRKTKHEQLIYPSKSSSYSNSSCSNKEGDKKITYADGSSVENLAYGCDTIVLDTFVVIEKFTFGCGQVRRGTDFEGLDGVLGLGQGDLSLMSQAPSQLGKVFSFCFQPGDNTLGYLYFGEEAKTKPPRTSPLMYTPLEMNDGSYQITLTGISVGAEKLDIDPSVFNVPGILDSGTVITRLPEQAYTQLQQTFNRSMSKYNSSIGSDLLLDTYYDLNGVGNFNEAIPEIVLHFGGGADVKLGPDGVVWRIKDTKIYCLAFAKKQETSNPTIIGNHQLLTFEVFHDLEGMRIGFGSNS